MKEEVRLRVKTVTASDVKSFDKLYNSTADELAQYDPEAKDIDALTARFYYKESSYTSESLADDFMQHHERCTCSDCPYLEIGTDARRKWFPCKYSPCGETRSDSEACDQFYKEAVAMMRKAAGRSE